MRDTDLKYWGCLEFNFFSKISVSKIDLLLKKGLIDDITQPKLQYSEDYTKEEVDNFNKELVNSNESLEDDIYFNYFFNCNKREYRIKREVSREIYDVLMENIRKFKNQEIRAVISKINIELSCRIDKEQKIDFLKKELSNLPKNFDLLHRIGINKDKKQLFAHFNLELMDMINDQTLKFYFEGGIYPFNLLRKNDIAKHTVFDSEHPLTQRFLQYYTFLKIKNYILFELKKLSTNKVNSKNKKDKLSSKKRKRQAKYHPYKFLFLNLLREKYQKKAIEDDKLIKVLFHLEGKVVENQNQRLIDLKEYLQLSDDAQKNMGKGQLATYFENIFNLEYDSPYRKFTFILTEDSTKWSVNKYEKFKKIQKYREEIESNFKMLEITT